MFRNRRKEVPAGHMAPLAGTELGSRREFPLDAGKTKKAVNTKGHGFCLVNDRKLPIHVLLTWDLIGLIVGLLCDVGFL